MDALSLRCPRDGSEIQTVGGEAGAFGADACPSCGGLWLARGEMARALESAEAERLIREYATGSGPLPCPAGHGPMMTRPVGAMVIDVCRSCEGAWFDAGDLEAAADEVARLSEPVGESGELRTLNGGG